MTRKELDDFKLGKGIPNCVLKARHLCEGFPDLLHQITLNGIKPPHNELVLSYMPSINRGLYTVCHHAKLILANYHCKKLIYALMHGYLNFLRRCLQRSPVECMYY